MRYPGPANSAAYRLRNAADYILLVLPGRLFRPGSYPAPSGPAEAADVDHETVIRRYPSLVERPLDGALEGTREGESFRDGSPCRIPVELGAAPCKLQKESQSPLHQDVVDRPALDAVSVEADRRILGYRPPSRTSATSTPIAYGPWSSSRVVKTSAPNGSSRPVKRSGNGGNGSSARVNCSLASSKAVLSPVCGIDCLISGSRVT